MDPEQEPDGGAGRYRELTLLISFVVVGIMEGEKGMGMGMETHTGDYGRYTPTNDGALPALAGDGAIDDRDAVEAGLGGGEGTCRKEAGEESGAFHFCVGRGFSVCGTDNRN